jgi:hypothetical protein
MKRKDNFWLRNVGGENLLLPLGAQVLDMNGVVILNVTGRCVWDLLAEDRSVASLAAIVAARFGVDSGRALADVLAFLDDIARMGLLEQ